MSVDNQNPVLVTIDLKARSLKEHIEGKLFCRMPSGLCEKVERIIRQEHRRPTVVEFADYDLNQVKQEVAAKLQALAPATDYIPQLAARAETVAITARDLSSEQVGYDLLVELGRIQTAAAQGTLGRSVDRNKVKFA